MKLIPILLQISAIIAMIGFLFLIWGTGHDAVVSMFMVLLFGLTSLSSASIIPILGWLGIILVFAGTVAWVRGRPTRSAILQLLAMSALFASSWLAFSTSYDTIRDSAPLAAQAFSMFRFWFYFSCPLGFTIGFASLIILLNRIHVEV